LEAVDVRAGTRDDLEAIQAVAMQACAEAIGELVPNEIVAAEARRRYPTASLCEHILTRQLLVGVDAAGRIEVVCVIDDRGDRLELKTALAPQHPVRELSGKDLLDEIRVQGWVGPITSECVLGYLPHERFHESAGFAPGEIEAIHFAGHEVFRRWWWLGPEEATGQ
jgi:hypothetical protein